MSADTRHNFLAHTRSIVIKLGSQLLTGPDARLNPGYLASIASQVAALRARNVTVTIVSSGAIAAGLGELKLPKRPTDLAKLQAVAAVGQRRLMDAWAEAFEAHRLPVAQVLLTREDIDDRTRFLNVRNTIHAVHELGAVPILNENDTISTDEIVAISFGDNDILASLVAQAMRADLLVLLSVVDGLLDADGKPVRLVESIDDALKLVRVEKSVLGKGGMNSKLMAAKTVTEAGEAMVVADGRMADVLVRVVSGDDVGTLFVPSAARRRDARRRWIGAARPVGTIIVDEGAAAAVADKHKSLLPAGVRGVEGAFERGDLVAIRSEGGRVVGQGLCNYASEQVHLICGKKTAEVRELLREAAYDEVIHRDNLVAE